MTGNKKLRPPFRRPRCPTGEPIGGVLFNYFIIIGKCTIVKVVLPNETKFNRPLFDSYLGVGKHALRPDLLLKLVIYEMQSNRPSPAQWTRDIDEIEPVRWLLFGMEPSRARLYDFRDRIASFLPQWNAQVLGVARFEPRSRGFSLFRLIESLVLSRRL